MRLPLLLALGCLAAGAEREQFVLRDGRKLVGVYDVEARAILLDGAGKMAVQVALDDIVKRQPAPAEAAAVVPEKTKPASEWRPPTEAEREAAKRKERRGVLEQQIRVDASELAKLQEKHTTGPAPTRIDYLGRRIADARKELMTLDDQEPSRGFRGLAVQQEPSPQDRAAMRALIERATAALNSKPGAPLSKEDGGDLIQQAKEAHAARQALATERARIDAADAAQAEKLARLGRAFDAAQLLGLNLDDIPWREVPGESDGQRTARKNLITRYNGVMGRLRIDREGLANGRLDEDNVESLRDLRGQHELGALHEQEKRQRLLSFAQFAGIEHAAETRRPGRR